MKKLLLTIFSFIISFNTSAAMSPIGMESASHYEISVREHIIEGTTEYIYLCAATKAVTKSERAQTMAKVIIEESEKMPDKKMVLYLSSHVKLCQQGRLIGIAYYSPDGSGWRDIKPGNWTWNILTTEKRNTEEEIAETIIYEDHKPAFKKKYGVLDYATPLDEFVKKEVGRKPKYVRSGLWIDTYFIE